MPATAGPDSRSTGGVPGGRQHYPEDAELLFLEGLVLRELGQRAEAEAVLVRLLGGSEKPHFASVDAGLRGFKARQNLAVLYQEQGRLAEAEAQWRAVARERPDFPPAWLGLAELYLGQQRWPELEEAVAHLDGVEAAVLRRGAAWRPGITGRRGSYWKRRLRNTRRRYGRAAF